MQKIMMLMLIAVGAQAADFTFIIPNNEKKLGIYKSEDNSRVGDFHNTALGAAHTFVKLPNGKIERLSKVALYYQSNNCTGSAYSRTQEAMPGAFYQGTNEQYYEILSNAAPVSGMTILSASFSGSCSVQSPNANSSYLLLTPVSSDGLIPAASSNSYPEFFMKPEN